MNYYAIHCLKFKDEYPVRVSPSKIIDVVCEAYNVTIIELMGKRRDVPLPAARQLSMYLIRKYCNGKVTQIGKLFNKDHTTVIHSCQEVVKRMDVYPDFVKKVQQITENL